MKQFPRIYAVSTVGLIFHYNSDYLLHPSRTDFNGESGIGKSMLADLLQLIFVAKRKYYKPGTDSSGTTGRDIKTLPLDSIGYAIVSIQKSEDLFLTIGVYIQRSTGAITPFIVQKGINWDKNSRFEYLNEVLLSHDFLTHDNKIPEIDFLRKNILKQRELIMETFYNDTSRYHQLLFCNRILPMDLSQDEDKLITYAQIIQSFARAKTLSFKDKDFKNFLFADDEDIFDEYKKQIETLERYHRQYIEQRNAIGRITTRFEILKLYKQAYLERNRAKKEFRIIQTAFDVSAYITAKAAYQSEKLNFVENSLKISLLHLGVAERELQAANIAIEKYEREISRIQLDAVEFEKEMGAASHGLTAIQEDIKIFDKKRQEFVPVANAIDEVDKLIQRYHTTEKIAYAIERQPHFKINKKRLEYFLNGLKQNDLLLEFYNSYYGTLPFDDSYDRSRNEIRGLNDEISQLDTVIKAYTSNENHSLMSWIRNKSDQEFSLIQESVLRYFIGFSTQAPEEVSTRRYIPSPTEMINHLRVNKISDDSVFIDFGGVFERIPLIKHQIFNKRDDGRLAVMIEELKQTLSIKIHERNLKSRLADVLNDSGWSREIQSLVRDREEILSFDEDAALPTENQFLKWSEWYSQKDSHKKSLEIINNKLEQLREKERDLLFSKSQAENKVQQAKNKALELNEEKDKAFSRQRSSDIEVAKCNERIEGVKIEGHEFITEQLINSIGIFSERLLRKYTINNRVDNGALYREEISPLEKNYGASEKRIKDFEDPQFSKGLEFLKRKSDKSKVEFFNELAANFEDFAQLPMHDEKAVEDARQGLEEVETKLKTLHDGRLQTLLPDNEVVKYSFDIETIARELLPNVFDGRMSVNFEDSLESDVMGHLNSINENMKQIDEHKIRLIQGIFSKVSKIYYEFDDKIKDIKNFFDEKEITGGMKVKIDFHPSAHYPIEWISALKKQINNRSISITPLFNGDENSSAEEIIINTFHRFSDSRVKDPDIRKLTNPKSYFDLEVSLVRPSGEKSDGSSGQDYAKIALLCIARLSRIERDKSRSSKGPIEGIRFMPIDEVAGLGGNFKLLCQIAEEYDYQIVTMTISPDLVLESGKQYVYILNSSKESNERKINMPAFGLFSDSQLQQNIKQFVKSKANAKKVNVAGNERVE